MTTSPLPADSDIPITAVPPIPDAITDPVTPKPNRRLQIRWLPWLVFMIVGLYFAVPLYATIQFSLQGKRGEIGFTAYNNVFASPEFGTSFLVSIRTALLTIGISAALVIPTAYWVNLRLQRLRPVVEFFTLVPFVFPAVIIAFGLIRAYNRTSLTDSGTGVYLLMIGAYISLSLPYMYRSIDSSLQAVNVRSLTEAAQSLGASWFTIITRIILPNIAPGVLTGSFITFAIVMGEFTIASLLSQPTFGPYMAGVGRDRVFEPSALAVLSFGLTWVCIAVIGFIGRRARIGTNTAAGQ